MRTCRSFFASAGFLIAICFAGTGCQLGPSALRIGQAQYSDALRVATSEQMLVNLVRMRYRDLPVFLGVTSIATQFQFDQSTEALGTLNENVGREGLNPNVLRLSGRFGYSEKPTITYSYLGGEAFLRRMLEPIAVENISLLAESGWRADRVLRLTVESLNGLDNASTASGPTPSRAPVFESFADAVRLIRFLEAAGDVEFVFVPRRRQISLELPRAKISSGDLIAATKSGATFATTGDSDTASLVVTRRVLVLRFSDTPTDAQDAARLRKMLSLEQGEREFEIVDATELRGVRRVETHPKIGLDTRSLMGVLYFLSQAVEVPERHSERGIVTSTVRADGSGFAWSDVLDDLFAVHSSATKPRHVAVAVKHRGYWFYINDDDESTKSTFSLLGQLFMLQTGEVTKSSPVLTLPVGG
ncbi:MAG: hypothetical protein GXP29_03210 [Planctomycetes bacterium]|nr:hypothetical protein [Planctomycetota bacterium]